MVRTDPACLTFTGSTEVDKPFVHYAGASNLNQVWPECGGNSANLETTSISYRA